MDQWLGLDSCGNIESMQKKDYKSKRKNDDVATRFYHIVKLRHKRTDYSALANSHFL